MLALIVGIIGRIFLVILLSSLAIFIMALFATVRNLPAIFHGLQRMVRSFLRVTFWLYQTMLTPLRDWIFDESGFDLFTPVPRILFSILFSLMIGLGLLALFEMPLLSWEIYAMIAHGLIIGFAWDRIMRSDEFQMGVSLE